MRLKVAVTALALVQCRPDPQPVLEPGPLPVATAGIGTAIAVAELGDRIEHRAVVGGDGRVELPLCGAAAVDGATAVEICERVAACLATAIREPLVEIAFERARASCSATGEPVPADDELLAALAARLPEAKADADLAAEIIDAIVDRHVALLRHTENHPEVQRRTERARRLLETLVEGSGDRSAAATHVASLLAEATRVGETIGASVGPQHPRMQQQARRIAALQLLADALGEPIAGHAALAFVLAHERALLDGTTAPTEAAPCPGLEPAFAQRIAYWQGRRDAAIDPSRAETILDGLLRARIESRTSCATHSPRP